MEHKHIPRQTKHREERRVASAAVRAENQINHTVTLIHSHVIFRECEIIKQLQIMCAAAAWRQPRHAGAGRPQRREQERHVGGELRARYRFISFSLYRHILDLVPFSVRGPPALWNKPLEEMCPAPPVMWVQKDLGSFGFTFINVFFNVFLREEVVDLGVCGIWC